MYLEVSILDISTGGTEAFSDVLILNVELLESTDSGPVGPMIAEVGIVGSGYNNWGAYADGFFYTTDMSDVYVSYVTLVDGEIKFRLNNDWGTEGHFYSGSKQMTAQVLGNPDLFFSKGG